MTDPYIENPELLKGGAKSVLADFVRQNTKIKVPEIFDSVEDALKLGSDVVIRSDDPREYFSLAGLLHSVFARRTDSGFSFSMREYGLPKEYIIKSSLDLAVLSQKILDQDSLFRKYLKLTGQKRDDFLKDFNFSIWERVYGTNGSMWADPVIKNKYHFVNVFSKPKLLLAYTQLNNGRLTTAGSLRNIEELMPMEIFEKLVRNYEEIRSGLDRNHCYEKEYQIDKNNEIYFLQLRRLKDFEPADFKIDRPPKEGEIEGSFVIGKTSSEGEVFKTEYSLYAPGTYRVDESIEAVIAPQVPLLKTRYPNAKAVIYYDKDFDKFVLRGFSHSGREAIGSAKIVTHIHMSYEDAEDFAKFPLKLLSDGEKCYVSRAE